MNGGVIAGGIYVKDLRHSEMSKVEPKRKPKFTLQGGKVYNVPNEHFNVDYKQYPCVKQLPELNLTVLFFAPDSGIEVTMNGLGEITLQGEYSNLWHEEKFTKKIGKVVIKIGSSVPVYNFEMENTN